MTASPAGKPRSTTDRKESAMSAMTHRPALVPVVPADEARPDIVRPMFDQQQSNRRDGDQPAPADAPPPPTEDTRASRRAPDLVTEDYAAREFARLYGGRLRFDQDAGKWREWNGSIWRESNRGLAFHLARELARDLTTREPEKARFVTSKTSFAAAIERFARADPIFETPNQFWDRDPMLLGTPSGVVDLRTGRFRPGNPADGITRATSVAPADNADCPLWLRFLEQTTGADHQMIRFLKQWCGYCLTGETREHALVFVFGGGGNGKTVFLNVLTGILGAYATVAAMDTFIAARGERHPTELAMLRGARVVTASETEQGRPWAESRIKQLTGGDAITAHFMRQDDFTFRPQFKLTIVGNHKPSLHSVDDAQRRRFNLVPFTRKPEVPDHHLEEKLKTEWPEILRWMIQGCTDWQANGLVRPTSVLSATDKYFADQDLIGQWLADECDAMPGNRSKSATSAALFASWTAYATRAGEKPGPRNPFAEKLEARGFEKDRGTGGVRIFLGVSLKSDDGQ
jgi:putative DNA primase/helicase